MADVPRSGAVTRPGARPTPSLGATPDDGRLSPTYSYRRQSADADVHPLARLSSSDPRSSSTQSLISSFQDSRSRRKLLIIYIHGFYGNAQSFRSFPAHVHSLLRNLLADTHIIHSKIYPRYKTYHALEVARDQFSAWLEPHESPDTDVILVGHSMGGLLAAEVVLLPNQRPCRQQPFKHRILGTISLDSPFLGLHPGIIAAGISSLFQPSPQPQANNNDAPPSTSAPPAFIGEASTIAQAESHSSSDPPPSTRNESDPHFDPPFWNDQPLREQSFFARVMHFASKHKSEGILNAAFNHIVSHLEYGGCLADYSGLMSRYNKIRALEDVDETQAFNSGQPCGTFARVRFVNYYTLSSGRAKATKSNSTDKRRSSSSSVTASEFTCATTCSPKGRSDTASVQSLATSPLLLGIDDKPHHSFSSGTSTPRISIDAPRDEGYQEPLRPPIDHENNSLKANGEQSDTAADLSSVNEGLSTLSMQNIEPKPINVTEQAQEEQRLNSLETIEVALPPLPAEPTKPEIPNLEDYTDKDARRLAEKEAKRAQKAYERAMKDRAKAVREREKVVQKRRKEAQKEAEKMQKEAQKAQQRREKEQAGAAKANPIVPENDDDNNNQSTTHGEVEPESSTPKAEKPRKRRKFCALPRKVDGVRDRTWIDVYMDGMDEVGAHCGLFFSGPHYDRLVGDVGSRIVGWVFDDMSTRAIQAGVD
ncbi:hypothetical protein HIM_06385 [Hirsutella minnesotensis 3608]|uniref:AB hydrolase-1 domain-containing protein n=1 Tax=Hirsutella minnesotensis 3608 TaxID=1043627 RepID=A0A0F8A4T8_9HYPO|nr:hypothetical protein HIM_06385 [Hirsutella minnesotensis 3608]